MELLNLIRTRLRVKSTAFDEAELEPLIAACRADLARVGVRTEETNPLAVQAVVLYCKGHFGFGDDSERYQRAYEALRDSMALSGEYGGGSDAAP